MIQQFKITSVKASQRLDVALSTKFGLSRNYWQKEIKQGHVLVNGKPAKSSYLTENGDKVSIDSPEHQQKSPVQPPNLSIVYEDENLLVVEKPAGLLVHPVSSHGNEATLAHFSARYYQDISTERPGIVHRLDRDTSGLIIVAKNARAKDFLQSQFKQRLVKKTYQLLVEGHLKESEALIDLPVGRKNDSAKRSVLPTGRSAQTKYKVLHEYSNFSLVEAYPQTGRTHQLRVHFSHLGHPIAGDSLYAPSKPKNLHRLFLHASRLEFNAPNQKHLDLSSTLPPELLHYLNSLK